VVDHHEHTWEDTIALHGFEFHPKELATQSQQAAV
jgi:hypothetical protein